MKSLILSPLLLILIMGCGRINQRIEQQNWIRECNQSAKFFSSKKGSLKFCECAYKEWSEGESSPLEAGVMCMKKYL